MDTDKTVITTNSPQRSKVPDIVKIESPPVPTRFPTSEKIFNMRKKMKDDIPDDQTLETEIKNAYGDDNLRKENEAFQLKLQDILNAFSEQLISQMNLITTTLSNIIAQNNADVDKQFST
ncbi:hypothetical protein PIROE2DRAFT_11416 [Piromyces sp. E2]|nr:hypothetical protein PIROE2DRAFT_11416 [Piromyces sp. E2]|eukprot:OUM62316.1 hypothetical protein PIROE2DRAFT_11416 [Piromyces sp. E2]